MKLMRSKATRLIPFFVKSLQATNEIVGDNFCLSCVNFVSSKNENS